MAVPYSVAGVVILGINFRADLGFRRERPR
jgi:hypothetical protein